MTNNSRTWRLGLSIIVIICKGHNYICLSAEGAVRVHRTIVPSPLRCLCPLVKPLIVCFCFIYLIFVYASRCLRYAWFYFLLIFWSVQFPRLWIYLYNYFIIWWQYFKQKNPDANVETESCLSVSPNQLLCCLNNWPRKNTWCLPIHKPEILFVCGCRNNLMLEFVIKKTLITL